ncbi:alpha-amylase family glycosyl hydrolase [Halorhabdus sp. CUG00001]|uniref:alpha-amylase family glycosyl hydrolase n=1 Tax=Halorhabdus sp. CUG00001 TaxID=2600297 RepID=UPI00131D0A0B|nr:alpha-amylase family glycosyl hydrolase [Halorhabdus sp. CUG00001]
MNHPGPPRFTTVGDAVELAPRDPDPNESYEWTLLDAPAESDTTVGDGAVEYLRPDVPGVYRVELAAPDGTHQLTVRTFPDEREPARFEIPVEDFETPAEEIDRVGVIGLFNDHLWGRDEAVREGDRYVFEAQLEPGVHNSTFIVNDGEEHHHREFTVEGPGRPRISLDAVRDGDVFRIEADARPPADSSTEASALDVVFCLDDRADLEESVLEVDGQTAKLPASAIDEPVGVHAVALDQRHSVRDTVVVGDGGDTIAHPNEPPAWVETATIYEIYVRAFAGERVQTTFSALERRLPYIESLGVDTVWLTPILASPTEHGYHITDFFEVATDLGTREEFESFVAACHERDIKVVFDLVINHADHEHPAFAQSAAGVPEFRDWFVWNDRAEPDADRSRGPGPDDMRAQRYFNWSNIPNFNYGEPAVRSFLLDVVEEWAPLVDGFRCDVAWGVPHGFWKEVRERVHEIDPEFLLLDETVPVHDPDYHDLEFDLHYGTEVYSALRQIGSGDAPAGALLDAVADAERAGFPDQALQMRYVENHDEERYLAEYGRDGLRGAVAATFTMPGVPMIYAGQERGMTDSRGPIEWQSGDTGLTNVHRRLSKTRSETPALESGTLERIEYHTDTEQAVAFARATDDQRVFVALHFGPGTATVRLPEGIGSTELVTGAPIEATPRDDGVAVSVADVLVVEATD